MTRISKCKLISVDAIKDFMAYKDIRITYSNGIEVTVNRKDIERFFEKDLSKYITTPKVTWRDLHFGYPNTIVRAIYPEEDKPKFVRRRQFV